MLGQNASFAGGYQQHCIGVGAYFHLFLRLSSVESLLSLYSKVTFVN